MANDFDVVVIGSGFGGAVTACRLAEAGYRVLILERGRRWDVKDYLRKPDGAWIWDQEHPARHNGWLDLRNFPNMAVGSISETTTEVSDNFEVVIFGWFASAMIDIRAKKSACSTPCCWQYRSEKFS